jgi:hypothetical protein
MYFIYEVIYTFSWTLFIIKCMHAIRSALLCHECAVQCSEVHVSVQCVYQCSAYTSARRYEGMRVPMACMPYTVYMSSEVLCMRHETQYEFLY